MTQEEKQLLLTDLCARLPYGVMCHANEINLDGELLFINKAYNIIALYNDKAAGKFDTCPIADVKPYLRPMSSMTEEEEREVMILWNEDFADKVSLYHCYPRTADFYNSHHLDYRGLIPMGLALEAPDGMYKTE